MPICRIFFALKRKKLFKRDLYLIFYHFFFFLKRERRITAIIFMVKTIPTKTKAVA